MFVFVANSEIFQCNESLRQRCKDMGLVVFRFVLQEARADAVLTLLYECRDLLFAKNRFSQEPNRPVDTVHVRSIQSGHYTHVSEDG